MKTQILLSCLLAGGFAVAQGPVYTTPVGYVTEELKAEQFNLIGLTLHNPTVVSGEVQGIDGGTLTAPSAVDFDSVLIDGKVYVLEITSGIQVGLVQDFDEWEGSEIVSVTDLEAAGVEVGDAFRIRQAMTLEEVFGTVDSPLNRGFSAAAADIVWIPDGSGGYDLYYLHTTNNWRDASTNVNVPNVPIVYPDGIFVEKKAGAAEFVLAGEVKLTPTSSAIPTGFGLLSVVYPVGSTIQNLGLEASISAGFSAAAADIVWVPLPGGGFAQYFYHTTGNWRDAATNTNLVGDIELPSAIFVERKGAPTNVTIQPPPGFSSL